LIFSPLKAWIFSSGHVDEDDSIPHLMAAAEVVGDGTLRSLRAN
jgi:hypothetical protein